MKNLVINIARKVQNENKVKIKFLVGTMIELPNVIKVRILQNMQNF